MKRASHIKPSWLHWQYYSSNSARPTAASFMLRVYPSDFPLTAAENQWIIKRKESLFLWSLEM